MTSLARARCFRASHARQCWLRCTATATLALGKTLLGLLEAGARGQQKALQRASERMSQKQVMLLGMLPAQYIVAKLPPQPQIAAEAPAPGAAEPVERSGVARPGGSFKIRY